MARRNACARSLFFLGGLLLLEVFARANAAPFDQIQIQRVTPTSLGIANANTAIADDPSAFYLNPAGLSRKKETRAFSLGQRYINRFQNFGIQASFIDGKTEDPLTWGLGFNFARTKREARFTDFSLAMSYDFDNLLMIGIGHRFTNFDLRNQTPENWNYTLNAGLLGFIGDYLALGASVENIYRSTKNSFITPVTFRGGISGNFRSFRVGMDIERDQSKLKTFGRIGGEYSSDDQLTFRGGFYTERRRREIGYTLGLGFAPYETLQFNLGFMDQLKSSSFAYASDFCLKF